LPFCPLSSPSTPSIPPPPPPRPPPPPPAAQVVPGELTIVTGVPNSGKSEWIDALLANLADMHDWCFALCSMEKKVCVCVCGGGGGWQLHCVGW
jgi:hypothetical protein